MSLDVFYHSKNLERQKAIRILSCEKICGKHIPLDFDGKSLNQSMQDLQKNYPERVNIRNGENSIQILTGNSKISAANWAFILGVKSSTKRVNLLCLKDMLWGIDMSSGLRMKKSTEKYGNEKIVNFLLQKVVSLFEEPEKWQEIQIYKQ